MGYFNDYYYPCYCGGYKETSKQIVQEKIVDQERKIKLAQSAINDLEAIKSRGAIKLEVLRELLKEM